MNEESSGIPSDKVPPTDLQSRLISPCLVADGINVTPNVPALFKRLLLFETYILQTVRFREFIPLVHTIGIHNVLALLNSDLKCNPQRAGALQALAAVRNVHPSNREIQGVHTTRPHDWYTQRIGAPQFRCLTARARSHPDREHRAAIRQADVQ